MSNLEQTIKDFSDDYLLEQYHRKKGEYTELAISIMKEEIVKRNLNMDNDYNSNENDKYKNSNEKILSEYSYDDFIPIEHSFSQKGVLLAREIITDENVPGLIKPVNSSKNNKKEELFTILVPKDLLEKTQEHIDKNFEESDGIYKIKFIDTKDRLKSFSFHELQLSEIELEEEINVEFTAKESNEITILIKRLTNEVDQIEETGKIVFYYDNLEKCEYHLSKSHTAKFIRADLLTILEVLQIYCEDIAFPTALFNTANALLDFMGY